MFLNFYSAVKVAYLAYYVMRGTIMCQIPNNRFYEKLLFVEN